MIYTDYHVTAVGGLNLTVSCSACGCSLTGDENYCPKCGRRLERRRLRIKRVEMLPILNDVIKPFESGAPEAQSGEKSDDA